MKRSAIIAFCLVFCIICGCAHTELTRRYKSKNYADAPKEYVKVSAFVMKPPQPPQNTLLSQITTPEGQAALISKMAEWAKSPGELYQALTVSEKGDEVSHIIDKTVFKKRVVFSVEKEWPGKGPDDLTPADRISALTVTLQLPKKEDEEKEQKEALERKKKAGKGEKGGKETPLRITNPSFENLDKFDNKYETLDLGTLKRKQHAAAEGTLEVGPAIDVKVPVKGGAKISRETTIDEEINLKQRFILMSGAIKNHKKEAVIFQESQVGYDLTGNFTVDFTIKINNRNRSRFVILSDFEKEPKDVTIDFGTLIYAVSSKPVKCDLASDYTIRHLRQLPLYDRYDRELAEGLHRVVFVSGKSKGEDVELISNSELRASVYEIYLKDRNGTLYLGRPVARELKDGEGKTKEIIDKNPLRFLKFEDAKRFLVWLKAPKPLKVSKSSLKKSKPVEIGKYTIYQDDGSEVKKEDIRNLRIRAEQLN